MFKKVRVYAGRVLAVGAGLAGAVAAHADTGVDTTAVTAALTANGTSLSAVGAAIIGTLVIAVGYKWVKGMLFG